MERYDITIQMYSADASGTQYVWEKVPAEEGELVLYTDAQATIAALQAVIDDHHRLVREMDVRLNGEQGAAKQASLCDIVSQLVALQVRVHELEQWVQDQSTANLETMRHTDEMQSRAMEAEQQLTQRTAELEAANKLLHRKNCELGRFETMISDLQAELERVRGELVWSNQCRQDAAAMTEQLTGEVTTLHTLVLALPKVEGEIVAQAGYVKDRKKVYACFGSDADMTAYAAIVQHRQGMEG